MTIELKQHIEKHCPVKVDLVDACDCVTLQADADNLLALAAWLKSDPACQFTQLIDLCAVDYLHYGLAEWSSDATSYSGSFSRATSDLNDQEPAWTGHRYAVVYHLMSITHNCRLRLRVFLPGETPVVDSVVAIWPAANWYEREAYDLMGVRFRNHPDLRRILTDYGFIGHPFRKDFPLSGHVEMRYDAASQRCVYEKVDIQPRVVVPKVIRHDNRYVATSQEAAEE